MILTQMIRNNFPISKNTQKSCTFAGHTTGHFFILLNGNFKDDDMRKGDGSDSFVSD